MSKLYAAHCVVSIFRPTSSFADIVAGVVVGTIVLMAVYLLVITEKYKSNFDENVWDET